MLVQSCLQIHQAILIDVINWWKTTCAITILQYVIPQAVQSFQHVEVVVIF